MICQFYLNMAIKNSCINCKFKVFRETDDTEILNCEVKSLSPFAFTVPVSPGGRRAGSLQEADSQVLLIAFLRLVRDQRTQLLLLPCILVALLGSLAPILSPLLPHSLTAQTLAGGSLQTPHLSSRRGFLHPQWPPRCISSAKEKEGQGKPVNN